MNHKTTRTNLRGIVLAALAASAFCLGEGKANAYSFSLDNNIKISHVAGSASFSENLSFAMSGVTTGTEDPSGDALKDYKFKIEDLTLDESSTNPYTFAPATSVNGLRVFALDGTTLLAQGDITPGSLTAIANVGIVFSAAISNVVATGSYLAGDSEILDNLIANFGAASITFQTSGGNLKSQIESGATINTSYSSTVSVAPVPSSCAMLVLSCITAGGASMWRKRKSTVTA